MDEEKKKEKRLLPADYLRKIKYESLDNTTKELEEQKRGRFFEFPEDMKGRQFQEREFLVFYFDDVEDYKITLAHFEIPSAAVSHPELNAKELARMVKRENARKGMRRKNGRKNTGRK